MPGLELIEDLSKKFCPRRFQLNTIEMFQNCLNVVLVNSDEMRDRAFRLRFQVYCLERGFENLADFPDGRELDVEDNRSVHSLLIDRASGSAVGTVRLILPRRGHDFPVFKVTGANELDRAGLPFESTAEVSRFAVAKAFRRQLEEGWCRRPDRAAIVGGGRGPALQLLTFGLIHAVVMMSALGGITHIVAMMEPALVRLLGRLGIAFHPLGGPVEHHGLRQPGWAVMSHLISSIKRCHPELGEIITGAERPILEKPALAHA
jgi:N-acyl amino acid synthase of PEP-CTERM/exosortase system